MMYQILDLFHMNVSLSHKNAGKREVEVKQKRIGSSVLKEYANISQIIMENIYDRYALDFELYGYSYDRLNNEMNCEANSDDDVRCC